MSHIQWKKVILTLWAAAFVFAYAATATATSPDPYATETKAERDARMSWWREARFGLFIHWGVYAVPAGVYKGEEVPSKFGEWIMYKAKIPVAEYKAFAKEFNPVKYDPAAWATLAEEAGMRYIIITAKHHDGFALYPSAVTEWDVADATPYRKDLIGPLAKAARDRGLKFGLYYSQAQDWVHPGGSKAHHDEPEGWDPAQRGDMDAYLKEIAAPQVGEILARYRPDILWWDYPTWMTAERAETLLPLIRIVPGIITNNRLGGGYDGDTETPENNIPATGFADRDWEVCMTMNHTWGYKVNDHDWKPVEDLIDKLCDIVSKGGNFLLNIGPTAEGEIPQASVERLKTIGKWMDVNSESIYGTTANPFHRLPWGCATKKIYDNGVTLYLQVFGWPENGKLGVPGLQNVPESSTLLAGGEELTFQTENGSLVINVPKNAPDPYVSVIKLEIKGDLNIDPVMPEQSEDGSIELTPAFVDLHNSRSGDEKVALDERQGKAIIGQWTHDRAWMSWTFEVKTPGKFKVLAEISAASESNMTFGLRDSDEAEYAVPATGSDFEFQQLGEISVVEPGVYHLEFHPVRDKWSPVTLGNVILKPVE